jgi:hypothetical protein
VNGRHRQHDAENRRSEPSLKGSIPEDFRVVRDAIARTHVVRGWHFNAFAQAWCSCRTKYTPIEPANRRQATRTIGPGPRNRRPQFGQNDARALIMCPQSLQLVIDTWVYSWARHPSCRAFVLAGNRPDGSKDADCVNSRQEVRFPLACDVRRDDLDR